MRKEKQKLVTPDELAKLLGVSRRKIYRLIWKKEIPALRIGHHYRLDPDEVLEVLKQRSAAEGLMKAIGGIK